jgi:hypothetical protein
VHVPRPAALGNLRPGVRRAPPTSSGETPKLEAAAELIRAHLYLAPEVSATHLGAGAYLFEAAGPGLESPCLGLALVRGGVLEAIDSTNVGEDNAWHHRGTILQVTEECLTVMDVAEGGASIRRRTIPHPPPIVMNGGVEATGASFGPDGEVSVELVSTEVDGEPDNGIDEGWMSRVEYHSEAYRACGGGGAWHYHSPDVAGVSATDPASEYLVQETVSHVRCARAPELPAPVALWAARRRQMLEFGAPDPSVQYVTAAGTVICAPDVSTARALLRGEVDAPDVFTGRAPLLRGEVDAPDVFTGRAPLLRGEVDAPEGDVTYLGGGRYARVALGALSALPAVSAASTIPEIRLAGRRIVWHDAAILPGNLGMWRMAPDTDAPPPVCAREPACDGGSGDEAP